MGIFSNLLRAPRFRNRTRTVVEPCELGLGPEHPDVSAALLEALQAEGERRLRDQFARPTKRTLGDRQ